MQVTKKTSVAGAYARKKSYEYDGKKFEADLKDGDTVSILDAGNIVVGEYGEQRVFKINTRNGDKNFSFNQTTINNLVDAFGEETDSWVSKNVKVWVIKAMVSGKLQLVAYLSSPDATMDEEGRFHLQGAVQTDIEYPEEESIESPF
jgi:hypothetical protein